MTIAKKIIILSLFILVRITDTFAQESLSPIIINYIQTYQELAIREMQRTGVPASITLAQGILETEAGQSNLVLRSNNHFGIKCKSSWTGEKVYHDDDERGECFRKYNAAEESYRDHSDYLRTQPRYASLFDLDPLDYKAWAAGLKKAGYATNPRYAHILIKYIETYKLDEYTYVALGQKSAGSLTILGQGQISAAGNQPGTMDAIAISTQPGGITENALGSNTQKTSLPAGSIKEKPVYPSGEFKLNHTRVMYATEGSSLLGIAEMHKIKLSLLLDFNDLPVGTDILGKGQLIFMQRKRRQGHNEFHFVEDGETLYDIAQQEALRLDYLLDYNQLQENMLPAPGEKLYLQRHASSRPVLAETKTEGALPDKISSENITELTNVKVAGASYFLHKVLPKETLYSLSKKYQVDKDKIREWNNLQDEDLKTGQELYIYKNR